MEIGKQFLPYKNPWTDTWHKTIGDRNPIDPDSVDSLETPNGYLTHHQYTGKLFHVTVGPKSNYKELFGSEDEHEKTMSRYLNSNSPEDYQSVVALHGGNQESALSALRIHNGRRITSERQSEMGAEYNAGFYNYQKGDKDYSQGLSMAASEYPEIAPPSMTKLVSSRTITKKALN
jgi:hypothetical protein